MADRLPLILIFTRVLLGLPFLAQMFWLGDEGVLYHAALHMLRGGVLYRDIFCFLPPGSYLLVTGWMAAFGSALLSLRLLALAVMAGVTALTYLTCRDDRGSRVFALVPAAFMMLAVPAKDAVVNHHWFTTLCALAALAALQRHRQKPERPLWPGLAGLFAGAALGITHSRGAVFCLAGFGALLPTLRVHSLHRRALLPALRYVGGALVVPVTMALWIIYHGATRPALVQIFGFVGTQYARIQYVPFGTAVNRDSWPVLAGFLFAAALTLVSLPYWLRGRARVTACRAEYLFALAAFVGCFPRPDVYHLLVNAPLAFPLVAVYLRRLPRYAPRWWAALALCVVAVGSTVPSYVGQLREVRSMTKLQSAQGPFVTGYYTSAEDLAELMQRLRRVPREDGFFFYPYLPMLAYLEARPHVASLDIFTPGYTTPAQYRLTCQQVVANATWVVIDWLWVNPIVVKQVWPAMLDPNPRELQDFHRSLHNAFDPVASWGRYELRKRNTLIEHCDIPDS